MREVLAVRSLVLSPERRNWVNTLWVNALDKITTLRIGISYSLLLRLSLALPTAPPFAGQVPSEKFLTHMAAFQFFVVVRNAVTKFRILTIQLK